MDPSLPIVDVDCRGQLSIFCSPACVSVGLIHAAPFTFRDRIPHLLVHKKACAVLHDMQARPIHSNWINWDEKVGGVSTITSLFRGERRVNEEACSEVKWGNTSRPRPCRSFAIYVKCAQLRSTPSVWNCGWGCKHSTQFILCRLGREVQLLTAKKKRLLPPSWSRALYPFLLQWSVRVDSSHSRALV